MRRRGFTITELILAIAVLGVAVCTMIVIFGRGARHAVMTRNHTAAIMVAQSLVEEIQGHPYGAPAPGAWPVVVEGTRSFGVWVEGKKQALEFHTRVEFANGSAIGKGADDWDRATVTVSWQEYDPVSAGGIHEKKTLVAQTTVWRQNAAAK